MKVKNYSFHKNLKELKKVRGQIFFFSAIWDHFTRNNCEKIHVHHVIIVVNLMLVILERVGLVIYRVTYNSNVGNLPIEWLIKNKRSLV